MKKIYHLLAFVVAVATFSACKPLSKTYDQLGDVPGPAGSTFSVTLVAADYKLLNKGSAAYGGFFKNPDTVKTQIPIILGAKYPAMPDKSTAIVTYSIAPNTVKLADSLNANVAFTLNTTPTNDYVYPAFNGNAANTFSDFSAAATLNYLAYKYQGVPDNTLRILTYLYFESGKTASAGTLTTDAFLFTGGGWQKIYKVSNAQYASVGNGLNNWFVASDGVNIASYLNQFLKADPTVMLTAKAGATMYVNYRYLTTFQRVLQMYYDGTNWLPAPLPMSFVKTNGVWVADNTISYTLTTADMKSIGTNQPTVGSAAAVANLASFGNYNIQGGATTWADDQIATSIAVFLKTKFPAAVLDQKFVITYSAYNGANITPKKTFNYDGSKFVLVP